MQKNIKKFCKELQVPRHVAIIAARLGITFQPNSGSSMYKLPPEREIISGQEYWNSPFGTLRLSDHWGFAKDDGDSVVFKTDIPVPEKTWILAVNANGWKVLHIFQLHKGNIVRSLDLNKIKHEIEQALCC